jgi:hypothetical protein
MSVELKPCPFCGCSMKIRKGKYPNGDQLIEPYGWHDEDCPLSAVPWYTWPEDEWTEERIAEAWNRRAET